ncbi:MAG: hypothetical protein FGM15_05295 [Chthoniobacterales bacterium]|nr:hypothetical protein [Chthoniobacterales bacterium]
MQTAITMFTPTGQQTKVSHGPEPLDAAKARLHMAMRSGDHEAGRVEIWTARGVAESFAFKEKAEKAAAIQAPTEKTLVAHS